MNTRLTLLTALAAATLFVLAPAQAQAPAPTDAQKLEAKIQVLQSQVNALQAQVQQLQQLNVLQSQIQKAEQLRASSPPVVTGRLYQIPNLPKFTVPDIQKQLMLPNAPRYSNIPDCRITLLKQTAR